MLIWSPEKHLWAEALKLARGQKFNLGRALRLYSRSAIDLSGFGTAQDIN